jgi:hypothetical protein
VRVVIGEVSDADAIEHAIAGADAVVSALGPSMDRTATGLPLVEGKLSVGFFGRDRIGMPVTRGDIAAFTAGRIDDSTYLKAAPAISN